MNPFTRVVENTDEPAAIFSRKSLRHGGDFFFCRLYRSGVVQLHACVAAPAPHFENVQRTGKVKRFVVQPDVRALVHVARRDADFRQCCNRLRAPRRAGLTVAGERLYTKNAPHICCAAALAPGKFGDAVEQPAVRKILRRRGVDGVKV